MAKKKEMCSSENHEPGAGIVLMKLEELHSFEGHPFKVERNQELFELRCSIEKEGVLVPLLVRKNPHGDGYELKKITPVDQFPNTVHVEVVCCLHRANS